MQQRQKRNNQLQQNRSTKRKNEKATEKSHRHSLICIFHDRFPAKLLWKRERDKAKAVNTHFSHDFYHRQLLFSLELLYSFKGLPLNGALLVYVLHKCFIDITRQKEKKIN